MSQVVRNAVAEGVLAEQVGIDSFNIGEHYRDDMMDSAAHVVLAAIAARTERIKLGTAVTAAEHAGPGPAYIKTSRHSMPYRRAARNDPRPRIGG